MKFSTAAVLVLAGVCSAAVPSETQGGHFTVIASSSNKAPQMLVVKGNIKSLTGNNDPVVVAGTQEDSSGLLRARRSLEEFAPYGPPGVPYGPQQPPYGPQQPPYGPQQPPYTPQKPYGPQEPPYEPPNPYVPRPEPREDPYRPATNKKASDWIVEDGDGPDGSGFEVEKGKLTSFESRRGNGRGGSGGICTGHLCYNNVIATVSGVKYNAPYGHASSYYGKEHIKLCLVEPGDNDSCWTVSCPSVKQVPRIVYQDCTPVDDDSCRCSVNEFPISAHTLKIRIDVSDDVRRLDGRQSASGVDSIGRSLFDCNLDAGAVAEVEIVCTEPEYD